MWRAPFPRIPTHLRADDLVSTDFGLEYASRSSGSKTEAGKRRSRPKCRSAATKTVVVALRHIGDYRSLDLEEIGTASRQMLIENQGWGSKRFYRSTYDKRSQNDGAREDKSSAVSETVDAGIWKS